ncbi:uncharacterized protein CTHT_0030700 [Thermochaetoides thermophila DSM 1495]|uniref:Major facilitator superfamily (MFS) profile domain-containing protein n=1 Tax=Chaetomium thermophilum (strain DSM 1495 / CBS 144.50 / IMI 039719) TaxID=759272 RepID=G0S449_CHATD|nr:hypothetical protein CTHT_0030700 [Thermochaetoides thermophila DSM 1495]EGS21223.1 hypothetical protein CTHT_0030700 [Thermochaetoides thermophila DSM 1495]
MRAKTGTTAQEDHNRPTSGSSYEGSGYSHVDDNDRLEPPTHPSTSTSASSPLLQDGEWTDGEQYTPQMISDVEDDEYKSDDDEEAGRVAARRLTPGRQPPAPRWRSPRKWFTQEEEQAVVRKFDRKLVVFVAGLYLLAFLDRSNIGNARIAGMDDDLQSSPPREDWYEWSLTAFYLAYIGFEWMAVLWRIIPAHVYVALIVFLWGLAASLQAVAVNYPMLIALRTLLGIGEAGFTGVPFYLSFFFKREELAFRTAIFVSAAPLATSFASSLAWLILKAAEHSPIAPWRLLFLVEGFPSVLAAALAWNIIPDFPQTASYLTQREKKIARHRLQLERPLSRPRYSSRSKSSSPIFDSLSALLDPAAWLTSLILFLVNLAYSSLPVFLPTILQAMGHSALTSQALAAPPYLVAFIAVLLTAHASDKVGARSPFLIAHALFSAAGYTILALSDTKLLGHIPPDSWIRYFAVYPAAIGFFSVVVLTVSWSVNNTTNHASSSGQRRGAAAFALLQAVGQCGPLLGTRLYPDRQAPYYTMGMAVCAVAMVGVAVLAGLGRWYLKRVNRRWDEEEESEQGEALSRRVVGRFRYML